MRNGSRLECNELFGKRDPFSEGADGLARRSYIDRIARLESPRTRPRRQHDAAGIEAERARQLIFRDALEIAAHDLEVDRIEACGMNFDQYLVKARDGICGIGEPHMVRDRTIPVEKKGPHRSPLPACPFAAIVPREALGNPQFKPLTLHPVETAQGRP